MSPPYKQVSAVTDQFKQLYIENMVNKKVPYSLRRREMANSSKKAPLTRASKQKLPASAFFLFKSEMLEQYKEANKYTKPTEITAMIALDWKNLPNKNEWEEKLKMLKENNPVDKNTTNRRARASSEENKSPTKPKKAKVTPNSRALATDSNMAVEEESKTSVDSKKTISVYYQSFEQKISFFKNTPLDAIDQLVKRLLKIAQSSTLFYLDEEGIPLVLVPEAIPNGSKVYVQVEGEEQAKATEASQSVDWGWLTPSNDSHKLKDDNKTVYQPVNNTMSWCFGDLVMEKGEVYYTLHFNPLVCCVYAGVESPNPHIKSSEFIQKIDFSKRFLESIGQKKRFPGPQVTAGFYINMEKKLLVITNHEKRSEIWRGVFPWEKVSPALQFKHVVSVTITSSSNQKPDWIKC